jgi:hypothetical protein
MREAHRRAFLTVATQRNVWIGVRETNSLAEKHIGVSGHHPKPADRGEKETARGFSPLCSPSNRSTSGGFSGTPHVPSRFSTAPLHSAAALSMQASHEEIQSDLNRLIGIPMIQNGPEFDWTGGVGAAASEYVVWFGPNHQVHVGISSMPFKGAAH